MELGPGNLVEAIERGAELPRGTDERFLGYGVVGLPFKSGHILCLRRWPASSLGQSYTSVWHRNPEGHWTFIQDAPPQLACTRYFGRAVSQQLQRQIRLTWTGPWNFAVEVAGDYQVHWQVSLDETFTTQLLNLVMGSGRMSLTGQLPHGRTCITHPRYMWNVASPRARVHGEELGEMGPLAEQARLGDFWIPQQGRFFIGQAFLENFDPDRHLAIFAHEG
ncbi:MAG: hypothetical protein P8X49_05135 [Syntrophobacterales bacterium]